MNAYQFGYPQKECKACSHSEIICNAYEISPFYKEEGQIKVMLIGQDPTIRRASIEVKSVLMLTNDKVHRSNLQKWIEEEVFGNSDYPKIQLYATNLVKCRFAKQPSNCKEGAYIFLESCFKNCVRYLREEIKSFRPSLVISLGETAHKLLCKELYPPKNFSCKMNQDFSKKIPVSLRDTDIFFDYMPCLHITTFRVAKTYGNKINSFRNNLSSLINVSDL